MIESVTFKNFKALRDATVPLSPLTLIVGPNASGKTSILEGLDCLARLAELPPEHVFVGARSPNVLRSSGITKPMELALKGDWEEQAVGFRLRATRGSADSWSYGVKIHWVRPDGLTQGVSGEWVRWWDAPDGKLRTGFTAAMLHLDPVRLAEPSYSVDKLPQVGSDGSNLPSVLADWAITDPAGFQSLQTSVRSVVPSFRSLGFNRVEITKETYWSSQGVAGYYEQGLTKYVGYGLKLDFEGGKELPASAVSEGTLITLGLLTVLGRPPVPRLVLIDELERGLHPKALGELIRQVRALMKFFPETQVIATTHSPYLVDNFQPEEIVLATVADDGSAVVGKLNEHPDFERWKDEMKPGEFWSTVGEDWLRERKASKS